MGLPCDRFMMGGIWEILLRFFVGSSVLISLTLTSKVDFTAMSLLFNVNFNNLNQLKSNETNFVIRLNKFLQTIRKIVKCTLNVFQLESTIKLLKSDYRKHYKTIFTFNNIFLIDNVYLVSFLVISVMNGSMTWECGQVFSIFDKMWCWRFWKILVFVSFWVLFRKFYSSLNVKTILKIPFSRKNLNSTKNC